MNNWIILLITIVAVGLSLPIFWKVFSTDKILINLKKYGFVVAAVMVVFVVLLSILLILTIGKSFSGQKILSLFGWIIGISLLIALAFEIFNRFNSFQLLGDLKDQKAEQAENNSSELYRSRTKAFQKYISIVTVENAKEAGSSTVLFEDLFNPAEEDSELKALENELKRLSVS